MNTQAKTFGSPLSTWRSLLRPARMGARALALCALAAGAAMASEYTVSPMRMELDRDARSTVVTLTNNGDDRIEFQLSASEWTQDADGKDRYSETREIVFFPKMLSIEPNEQRVVRVGIRSIPAATERTFRLFIEKIPAPSAQPQGIGARVAINFRFGLPIFVKPPVHEARGEIVTAEVRGGRLALVLRNSGNEHFRMDEGIRISGLDPRGEELVALKLDDHYLLAGTTKRYTAALPSNACGRLANLQVAIATEGFTLDHRVELDRTSCE